MLDLNHDGCFSFEEFSQFANHRCGVNWLTDFLKTVDLDSIFTLLGNNINFSFRKAIK